MAECEHLVPGVKLPVITLLATDGSEVCLASLRGQSVAAIYPWTGRPGQPNPPDWDNIPGAHGSTPELEGFRDLFQAFTEARVRIFGVSGQGTDYQREMAARLHLPFPIVSDPDGRFAAALALPTFAAGETTYLKRLTLLIADGVVEHVFYPVADPAGHASEVLKWLESRRPQ